ncbi:MAG TPA: transcription termination/antitermination protein NusA [Anaerolineae bacterium]|nr:transcription termination/antitermination protein NusA [Anaerolineae bacterium]
MNKQLLMAINQICAERNLKPQVVIDAIEQALISAYRKNFGTAQNVEARLDPETGDTHIYAVMQVVSPDELTDPNTQITLEEARTYRPNAEIGDEIRIERTPDDFGRIAAQAAKQVILQRIREAERDALYEEYVQREGELIQGVVRSIDRKNDALIISLDGGQAEGVMHRSDQIPGERYRPGNSVLAYVVEVTRGGRGPNIHLSRTHRNMLRRLLEKEVPEIKQGVVEIKAIAREAGSRSKVAVAATQRGVDPVGSCVGMRGVRIQNIVKELHGEKIDVVEWDSDPEKFVANALSPAKVTDVILFPQLDKTALVIVSQKQLSLAIGKEGQNARLVAKLTGWRIDIKSEEEALAEGLTPEERDRLRREQKARAREADLMAAARRLLEEEALAEEGVLEPGEELDAPLFDLKDEMPPVVEDALEAEPAEPELVEAETPVDKEAEVIKALAAKLSTSMAGGDIEDAELDEELYARFFESKEDESIDALTQTGSKKKKKKKSGKRKDRKLVFDEELGRLVQVKRRKRGGSDLDYDDFEDFGFDLDDF